MRTVLIGLLLPLWLQGVALDDTAQSYPLKEQMGYLYDGSGTLTADEAAVRTFSPAPPAIKQLPTGAQVWTRLTLTNQTGRDRWLLEVYPPYLFRLSVYEIRDGAVMPLGQVGKGIPFSLQNHTPPFHLLPLTLPPGKSTTLLMQVEDPGQLLFPLSLKTEQTLSNQITQRQIWHGLFFGIMGGLIIYHFMLFLYLRESAYLLYSLMGLSMVALVATTFDYTHALFWPQMGVLNERFHPMANVLAIIFTVLFTIRFLNLRQTLPVAYRGLGLLGLWSGVLFIYGLFQPLNYYLVLNTLTLPLLALALLSSLYLVVFKRDRTAGFYLAASGVLAIGALASILQKNNLIEFSILANAGFELGSALEAMLLSLGLAYRIKRLEQERAAYLEESDRLKARLLERSESALAKANEQLRRSLGEKETLLKEVYHRVKNNLQIVITLLWHQQNAYPKAADTFRALIDRIKAMSLVHERLYQRERLDHIHLDHYLSDLIAGLGQSYGQQGVSIQMQLEPEIVTDADTAITLGLIANELITNAYRHAFGPRQLDRHITISLQWEEGATLFEVIDNGQGCTQEASGTGSHLINSLIKRLPGGTITRVASPGCHWQLRFSPATMD
jgi:two-component sensor histidine kinase